MRWLSLAGPRAIVDRISSGARTGIAPQVVFEVLSPGNRLAEMIKKFQFYDRYRVEEYYIYDPDRGELSGWARAADGDLIEIDAMTGWVSPRLGVRFECSRRRAGTLLSGWPQVRQLSRVGTSSASRPGSRPSKLRQQAEQARQQAEQAQERAERLAEQLRALGVEPE